MTRYFFGADGTYLGGFDGDGAMALVPKDAVEWPQAPDHGYDRLVDGEIVAHVPQPPLDDQLKEIFKSLDLPVQVAFGQTAAAVFLFLQNGNQAAAKLTIQDAQVPPELEKIRAGMLSCFP